MECYLEGCSKPALGEERCFAYCCIEHKAKVVMIDEDIRPRTRTIKEAQLGLKRLRQDYLNKKAMEQGEGK